MACVHFSKKVSLFFLSSSFQQSSFKIFSHGKKLISRHLLRRRTTFWQTVVRPDHAPSAIVTAPVAVIVAAASVMMHVVAVATMMDVSDSDSMMRLVLQVHAHVHARDGAHISGLLALFLLLLPLLVVHEVVENGGRVLEGVDDLEDHLPLLRRHLLGVTAVGHRLVLIVFEPDVTELTVRNVFHVDPLEASLRRRRSGRSR